MALPPGLTAKSVTIGIASFTDGSLADGTVTITAPVNLVHTPTNRPIFSSQMSKRFVDGEATFDLLPTDAPGLNRIDWVYKANVVVSGALVQPDPIYFLLPEAGPNVVDLDGLVTVPSSAGTPISVDVLTSEQLPAQMATVAADEDSAFAITQRAAFGRVPAHAGSRTGSYDAARSVYNLKASNTRRVRAALGAARAGTGLARLTFVGDSLTAGAGTTRGTADPITQLRRELERLGYKTGEFIQAFSGLPDPRVVLNGGDADWFRADPEETGVPNSELAWPWVQGRRTGATMTVTGTGSVVEIAYSGEGDPLQYSIDGAAAVTLPRPGNVGVTVQTVTGLADTSHTITLTTLGGYSYVYGVGFRPATGVVLHNAGVSGAMAANHLGLTYTAGEGKYALASVLSSPSFPAADLYLVELGANEAFESIPATTARDNLVGLVDRLGVGGATVALTASNYPQDWDASWRPYVQAVYDTADARDRPLLDLADRWGLFTAYNADGLTRDMAADAVHLTATGNAVKVRAWLDLLPA